MTPEQNPNEAQEKCEVKPGTSKYASVLFQAKEFYDIGPFRLPVYNALTPAEAKAFTEYEKSAASKQLQVMRFARDIGKKFNVKTKVVLDSMQDSSSDLYDEIVYDYADQMQEIKYKSNTNEEKKALVTVSLRSRGSVKLSPESDYIKTLDWTIADTEGLLSLVDDLFQFLEWEKSGWPKYTTEDTDNPEVPTLPLAIQQPTPILTD